MRCNFIFHSIGAGDGSSKCSSAPSGSDACNLFVMGDGINQLSHKLDVLKRHCAEVGRDYNEIERTALGMVMLAPGAMSSAELIGLCRQLADTGVQHFIFSMPNVHDITPLEVIGREVLPVVAGF